MNINGLMLVLRSYDPCVVLLEIKVDTSMLRNIELNLNACVRRILNMEYQHATPLKMLG